VNQEACERYAVPVSFKRPVMLLIIKSSKNSIQENKDEVKIIPENRRPYKGTKTKLR
jgi:hypothetical protein